jgi:glycyl-tRNA synthetase beta chain
VLVAEGLAERQADREEILKGPPKNVAFDAEGKPTKAAEGFAKRAGVSLDAVTVGDDNKLTVQRTVAGRATTEILAEVLPDVIIGIYFPKTMYWTAKNGPRFIRPVRWLLALFDGKVVDFEIAGVRSANRTQGHRRLGSADLEVTSAADFREKLAANSVILSTEVRRKKIENGIAAMMPGGFRVGPNAKLLSTLVNITEHPTPVFGEFDPSYLTLPEEVLETVMEHHQKYFAVEHDDGKLAARFIAVSNLDGDPDGIIRQGHERVLRARFNDARF